MFFIAIIAILLLFIFPVSRCFLLHLIPYLFNRFVDLYEYIFEYKINLAEHLGVRIFIANSKQAMRSGKTLSMVNYVIDYYKRYNNKTILVDGKKKKQKIIIISNINILGVHSIKFNSFEQLNTWYDTKQAFEKADKNSVYKALFVLDEIGAVCNSRQYKNNFNIANISSILQMGHLDVLGVVGSAQRFSLCDALLRQVTDLCITSQLLGLFGWKKRFVINNYYLGHDLEESQSDLYIKPIRMTVSFLYNRNYDCYNTKELANTLTHDKTYLSNEEILQNLALHNDNLQEHNLKKKYKKKQNK